MKYGFLALVLTVLAPQALAVGAQADKAQAALSQFFDQVQTLSARFEQLQRNERGELTQTTSGRMWLARPAAGSGADVQGKFRWSYEKPYEQLMVCDGDKIWMYDPDLSQATVRPAAATLAGTPAQLLSRKSALNDEFTVEDAGEKEGVRTVRLKPKSADSDFQSIELSLREGSPTRMVFHDQLGDASEVRFTDVKTNARLDDSLFSFKPPKGTEVIEAEIAGARSR
jgi:chaperone LolA